MLNLRSFGDPLVWVSILVRKRLELRPVLEVQYCRNWCCHSIVILYIEFQAISRSFALVSILGRKRLDLLLVLDVQYGCKGFGYLEIRERLIN